MIEDNTTNPPQTDPNSGATASVGVSSGTSSTPASTTTPSETQLQKFSAELTAIKKALPKEEKALKNEIEQVRHAIAMGTHHILDLPHLMGEWLTELKAKVAPKV